MNTKLILWILSAFVAVGVLAILWYVTAVPIITPETQQQAPGTVAPFPSSGTNIPVSTTQTGTSTSSPSTGTMTLSTRDNEVLVVNDFLHNNVTIPDEVNPGRYLLAGNLGYCPSHPQQCQAASSTSFMIFYNTEQQSFTVALTAEPIGQARLDMEQFLILTLGIPQQQLCKVKYYIGVARYVNDQYTATNLGFSFCSGATSLPQ